jgi:uncharacterized protein (DUF58 family)
VKLAATLHERFATWALRTRPPEPTPILLSQRRVYVLPTRAGVAYAAALLVMLLAAVNYNLSLGHALVFLLAGLGVVAILHTFRNLVGLAVETGRADPVFAGDVAQFSLLLNGAGDRRRICVGTPADMTCVDIDAGVTTEARVGVPAPRRGRLALPRVTLETSYPLGLVRSWSYVAPAMYCLVYPRPAIEAPPLVAAAGDAGGRLQESRGNDDFAGLRSHQAADPPRHVAWKTAARQDASAPLMTKQFAGAAAAALWVDWHAAPSACDTETRLSILARWILDAAAEGLAWGLRLPGVTLPPASGEAHLHACLRALALHENP